MSKLWHHHSDCCPRSRFKLGAVLDDPCVAELFFEHLNCTGLHLYEVHRARPNDDRSDGGRALAAVVVEKVVDALEELLLRREEDAGVAALLLELLVEGALIRAALLALSNVAVVSAAV